MKEDPRVQGSRPVKGLSGSWVHVCACVCVCGDTCVWVLQDANEVARLSDKHCCLLLAQQGCSERGRAGRRLDQSLLHHVVAAAELTDRQIDGRPESQISPAESVIVLSGNLFLPTSRLPVTFLLGVTRRSRALKCGACLCFSSRLMAAL